MKYILIALLFVTLPLHATQDEEEPIPQEAILGIIIENRLLIDSLIEDYLDLKKRLDDMEDRLMINIIYDEKVRTV